jgi:hypothetical protein
MIEIGGYLINPAQIVAAVESWDGDKTNVKLAGDGEWITLPVPLSDLFEALPEAGS